MAKPRGGPAAQRVRAGNGPKGSGALQIGLLTPRAYPLITPTGLSRHTSRARPALRTTATTSATSL